MAQLTDHILARLRSQLGAAAVVTEPAALREAAHDRLRARRSYRLPAGSPALPFAVVRPDSTADVVATVDVARAYQVPVIAFGGGTGLMGGALSLAPGIVIDTRSMHRVLAIDAADRTATAQAGLVIADLNAALEPFRLMAGHDPWTVQVATVGGTLGTNGLGYLGGRYGGIADQVLGLEVVLGDGRVLRTRSAARSSTGPRLGSLFAGAEGTIGIVTEATLRVFPIPERRALLGLDFPSFADGLQVAMDLHAIGLPPAVLDFGAPPGGSGRMYLGFDGPTEVVEASVARALTVCGAHGGHALPDAVAQTFWAERHIPAERLREWQRGEEREPVPGTPGSSVFDYLHVCVPASRVMEYIGTAERLFAEHGVSVREWGLWHGPQLLSVAIARSTDTPAEAALAAAAADQALMLAQDLGGSMEYVHGAGIRNAHLMAREHGEGLALLRDIKRVFDPDGILNPGKLGLSTTAPSPTHPR